MGQPGGRRGEERKEKIRTEMEKREKEEQKNKKKIEE